MNIGNLKSEILKENYHDALANKYSGILTPENHTCPRLANLCHIIGPILQYS
jgi:hypothetical protein